MVMDLVFSIDSVITAVGLAEHLIVMILAVMIAVFIMMIFIDPISNFINSHPEMKILALVFICAIGVLLVLDSAGIHTSVSYTHLDVYKRQGCGRPIIASSVGAMSARHPSAPERARPDPLASTSTSGTGLVVWAVKPPPSSRCV